MEEAESPFDWAFAISKSFSSGGIFLQISRNDESVWTTDAMNFNRLRVFEGKKCLASTVRVLLKDYLAGVVPDRLSAG
jgi:hypothetical protein